MVEGRPSTSVVWKWLADVPDPEIPAISLLDLGVIRDIQWRADTLEVTVTPTYSGCPATSLIDFQIEAALSARGIQKLTLKRQIAPPWTTDLMSDAGCKKLEAYGIAPPRSTGSPKQCPRCKSNSLEEISEFGSTPCKAQWRCKDCLEPFDYFKCI